MSAPERLAARHLLRIAVDRRKDADFEGAPLNELIAVGKMLARQVSSMDPKSVAYGTYVSSAFRSKEEWIHELRKSLLMSYRKHLIEWMEHALVKRANLGGGGSGIKKVENGLAAFAEAVPDIIQGKSPEALSHYLPDTEYFVSQLLDPIGKKILAVVQTDAKRANVQKRARREHRFTIQWDDRDQVWFIPFDLYTYDFYDQLAMDGFRASRPRQRWEYEKKRLPPDLLRRYDVEGGPAAPTRPPRPAPAPRRPAPGPAAPPAVPAGGESSLHDWYFGVWLPKNIGRFSKVFSDFARSKQSSYETVFSVSGRKVSVKFKRQIDTPAKAVEELRYRYINRQGRESWLEVMDFFIKLVAHTSPDKTMMFLIDRINNLQHSNGLFMEHFPSDVKSWYEKFLNAKYHAPTAGELAKYIPDRDLKNLFLELTHYLYEPSFRGPGYQQSGPAEDYQNMTKDLPPGEDWRAKGYPFQKGLGQVSREDARVQRELEKLDVFQNEREIRMIEDPDVLQSLLDWLPQVKKWRESAELPEINWTAQPKLVLERHGVPAVQVEKALAPIIAWHRSFKSLVGQEPKIPTTRDEFPRYQRWMNQIEDHLEAKSKSEAIMQETLASAQERRRQRQQEMEDYWRETRMARLLMAQLLGIGTTT